MNVNKAKNTDTGTVPEVASESVDDIFLTPAQLCAKLHLGRGRLRAWQKQGILPYIQIPGGRKIIFSWNSTKAALARMERTNA